jgi:clorobiocin/coumermycin A biosynthesis protein CloN7/CouN7
MPGSDPVAQTLDVPGARLYYERQGAGPLLVMIGSPMDSTGFAGLARALASRYTVVTYDPRGIGHSTREDATQDVTPERQADDVHRLLSALGGEPAHVFGSSGGAVVGLALVTAHPGQVRTLVAHEPPVIKLLPDREQVRAQIREIYDTYRTDGADKAMAKFMAHAGLGQGPGQEPGAPRWEPSPEQVAAMRATTDTFLAHLIRPTTDYRPDIEALRGSRRKPSPTSASTPAPAGSRSASPTSHPGHGWPSKTSGDPANSPLRVPGPVTGSPASTRTTDAGQ